MKNRSQIVQSEYEKIKHEKVQLKSQNQEPQTQNEKLTQTAQTENEKIKQENILFKSQNQELQNQNEE
jgi:hypothetical protein